mmetsp:Transcript_8423/g.11845  ORF Transcript_8423/g.11845 Transcript_8423/m.11845 type:complete len:182 (-) Transcript_8423:94-639(-)
MTGTYASQFVMEGFLNLKICKWKRAMITRIIALGPALATTIAMRENKYATDSLSEGINVLMSIQLPFALIPLIHFNSNAVVMGEFRVGAKMKALLWILAVGVIVINLYIVINSFSPFEDNRFVALISVIGLVYLSFCAYLVSEDFKAFLAFVLRSKGAMVQSCVDDSIGTEVSELKLIEGP